MKGATMSNIVVATVLIEGTRPLLWHAFGPGALPLEKQEKTGVAGNDPEEWRKTVLALPDGQLFIKHTYIFGCMREAAKYTKRGRGSVMKYVAATLQVPMDIIPIKDRFLPDEPETDHSLPVYLDIQGVVNPSTRGRNVRYRIAASSGWQTEFTLLWDPVIISRGEMENIAIDAGRLVGLGDGRSIGYGRFEVLDFDIQNGA
jgi:hypothetical protein